MNKMIWFKYKAMNFLLLINIALGAWRQMRPQNREE